MVDADSEISGFAYATEDLARSPDILKPGQYDVVVGNPPYITVKDKKLNDGVPDSVRHVQGQVRADGAVHGAVLRAGQAPDGDRTAGWIGQITSNSFMKREFGTKLIEDFLSRARPAPYRRHLRCLHPRPRHPDLILVGRPHHTVAVPSTRFSASAASLASPQTRRRDSCGPRSWRIRTTLASAVPTYPFPRFLGVLLIATHGACPAVVRTWYWRR